MRTCSMLVCVVTVLMLAATAEAQEKGKKGLTIAFPSSVGFIFHTTDRLAIRPDFTFSTADAESDLIGATEQEASFVGVGVSVLSYLRKVDGLRTYVVPSFQYSHASNTSSLNDVVTNTYAVTGAFGAEYALSRQFSVFAEAGLAYRHSTASSGPLTGPFPGVEITTNSLSTRGGIGAVIYF